MLRTFFEKQRKIFLNTELISKGIHHIYKYGVAFSGKHVCVSGK